jgi:cbb3-type cytochrome oxidase cytochrome c subunit
MKGIAPLLLGIFATFAFSWVGLILIPNYQIGHLEPQVDEEGNDPYPAPKSGMANRGRQIYAANGCVYCHSQQVRGDYAASDLERVRDQGPTPKPKWGERRSAPRDYLFERPVLLGKMRLGPDLANIGKSAPVEQEAAGGGSPIPSGSPSPAPANTGSPAAGGSPANPAVATPASGSPSPPAGTPASPSGSAVPTGNAAVPGASPQPNGLPAQYSAAWHHRHLYSPRSVVLESNMPAYRFLYEKRRIGGERAPDALQLGPEDRVHEGWEVVPSYDARCLVAYLMSLDQSHALQEVKGTGPAPAPAKAGGSPAPAPPKEAK